MKKLLCFSILIACCITSYSQSQFGIFAGPQITSVKYSINSVKQSNSNKTGFQLGAGWKIPFENRLSFSPAAFYSLKGYKVKYNLPAFPPDTLAIDNNTTFHTLELAFLLQLDLGKNPGHFFIKAGPSLDFQLAGKEKYTKRDNSIVDRTIKFGYQDYGHYSANLLLHVGFETPKGLYIFGQYTHGVASLNNADNGPLIRHRAYGISIGKYIGKKKAG